MISTNQFKIGWVIEVDGELQQIIDFQHIKPGKGQAFVRTRMKNLRTGAVQEKNFSAGDKFELARMERREAHFLYSDDSGYHFMDNENYEQIIFKGEEIEDEQRFLKEGMAIHILHSDGKPLSVELPVVAELEIVETEPGVRGDTVSGSTKPAKVETGAVVKVPLFLDIGDVIRVDTRTGEYLSRA